MEIELLLKHILPEEIFEYFDLKEVKELDDKSLSLYLDEKNIVPPEHEGKQIVSNGFHAPVKVQDFPLRKKSVYLIIRRRKWKDTTTGNIYSRSWDLTAKGSSYSKEFADFLKGLLGHLPDQQ
jgi:hypothetical protein